MSTKDHDGVVYHIQDPAHMGSLEHGYIGVTVAHRGAYERFKEHRADRGQMRSKIKKNCITFEEHVKVLFEGPLDECFSKEKELRPIQRTGWNIARGGQGYNYRRETDNLNKRRSENQTKRMQDPELRKKQGETFKTVYYADPEIQALRRQRTHEHMSDPDKREKCLSVIHKKIKCFLCDYENNPGNVAIHMKKVHRDV